jgi:hypothetical protein
VLQAVRQLSPWLECKFSMLSIHIYPYRYTLNFHSLLSYDIFLIFRIRIRIQTSGLFLSIHCKHNYSYDDKLKLFHIRVLLCMIGCTVWNKRIFVIHLNEECFIMYLIAIVIVIILVIIIITASNILIIFILTYVCF